jgi:hypothetical protein
LPLELLNLNRQLIQQLLSNLLWLLLSFYYFQISIKALQVFGGAYTEVSDGQINVSVLILG